MLFQGLRLGLGLGLGGCRPGYVCMPCTDCHLNSAGKVSCRQPWGEGQLYICTDLGLASGLARC